MEFVYGLNCVSHNYNEQAFQFYLFFSYINEDKYYNLYNLCSFLT